MTGQFDRIIYSHPAGQDGFDYFYIAYRPGVEGMSLKYKRTAQVAEQTTMDLDGLMSFLDSMRRHPTDDWPFGVVDRAARLLRSQIQRWNSRNSGEIR